MGDTWGNTLKTHRRHHHNIYCQASLGAAALAFCVNYTAVHFYVGAAWLCVNDQGEELANHRYSDSAASQFERGYWFANTATLIPPPEADQCQREISPLTTFRDIHTEAEVENCHRICSSKRQCEWGYRLVQRPLTKYLRGFVE